MPVSIVIALAEEKVITQIWAGNLLLVVSVLPGWRRPWWGSLAFSNRYVGWQRPF